MDYVRLVHEGDYKDVELNEEHWLYIQGMKALQTVVRDLCLKVKAEITEDMPTLDKLKAEIIAENLDYLEEQMEAHICEAIVTFADEEACDIEVVEDACKEGDVE